MCLLCFFFLKAKAEGWGASLHLLLKTLLLLLLGFVKKLEVHHCAVPQGFIFESQLAAFDSKRASAPGYFRGNFEGAEKNHPDDGTPWRTPARLMGGKARLVSSMLFFFPPSSEV